jgi:hypothetical protein
VLHRLHDATDRMLAAVEAWSCAQAVTFNGPDLRFDLRK